MTPNPIRKVLSTLQHFNVKSLLMGGQACVFYGAAEFSRDTDIALLAEPDNFNRLEQSLQHLHAEVVAVPPVHLNFLQRGHAIHFRCQHPDANGMRLDVMSVMRGLPGFPILWDRRTTVEIDAGETYELMSLPDLVVAKKTQRDKDWPMIRRLIESDYQQNWESPTPELVRFWLKEARTPSLLREIVKRFPELAKSLHHARNLLTELPLLDDHTLEARLNAEEEMEREKDRVYWKPLREELEQLRRDRIRPGHHDV